MTKLVIDGSDVYEIDEECIRQKQKEKEEQERKEKGGYGGT